MSLALAVDAANLLKLNHGISSEVIDLRVLSPLNSKNIINSVLKTKNLIVIDGGTKTSGFAAEIITSVVESIPECSLSSKPLRLTLPDCPAPTSRVLEDAYYPNVSNIVNKIVTNLE